MSGIRWRPKAPEGPSYTPPTRTKGRTLILFLLLAALSACLVRLMIRQGALDHPVARSSHTVPTPKGGGVGIAAAYAVGTLWLLYRYTVPWSVLAPLCAGLALAVVSYVDDVRPGPFVVKLGAQIAAAIAVMSAGDTVADVALSGAAVHLPALIQMPLTLVLFLFVTNAINFIDGLNGLASGSTLLGGAALVATAPPGMGAQALPLVAGIAGFLPFNYPRARIFMGDVGSQLCGFVAADLTIRAASLPSVSLLMPLAMMPIYFDVGFTLLRRASAHERLTQAHRSHIYQVANRAGMSAPVVAAVYWVMTAWGALCGFAAGHFDFGKTVIIAVVLLSLTPMPVWLSLVALKARRAGITPW